MKKKDVTDLNNKTIPELEKLSGDLRAQIVKAKMEIATRKAKNTNLAKNLCRDLARILSIKKGKELYANS